MTDIRTEELDEKPWVSPISDNTFLVELFKQIGKVGVNQYVSPAYSGFPSYMEHNASKRGKTVSSTYGGIAISLKKRCVSLWELRVIGEIAYSI